MGEEVSTMGRDEDNRSLGERMRRPPALRLGMGDDVETNAGAELAMRVKALEADVAALQRKISGLTGVVEMLIDRVDRLR
jgi:hypothetical protein